MALCLGLPRRASTRKVKPIWILLKKETVSGSGISLAICKSAHRSRQITIPAPPPLSFLQAGCPSCHPTNSVKELKAQTLKAFVQYGMNVPLILSLFAPGVARVVFSNTALCGFLLSYAHAFLYVYMHYVFYFEGGKDICRNCHRLQKDF